VAKGVLFSTAALFARPLQRTMSLAAQAGFEGVEVMVTQEPSSQDPGAIGRLAKEHDLRVGAVHAPCLLLTRKVWSTDPVVKIYRSIQVAEEVGASIVVVHPPYRWQRSFRGWLETSLPDLADDTGVTVAVENMFPIRAGRLGMSVHANQDLDELDRIGSIVLDTSHAAVAGHDPIALRRRFGDKIKHVHLSDNAGRGWDSHLPPGQGVLDLAGFLADLAAGGYAGDVSLEVDLRPYMGDEAKLVEEMRAVRSFCQALC
jgi:sugar phosphate isomerase/epimerase